jgi:hypothetical protein
MDFKKFIEENKVNYRTFIFDKENNDEKWDVFYQELTSFLGLNHYGDNLSEDYMLYGGITILNHEKDKLIFVPINWNTNTFDYLIEKTKSTSQLRELNF